MPTSDDLVMCATCGTQFDVEVNAGLKNCNICDDPRQYVPPGGQVWTSLGREKDKHGNKFEQYDKDSRIWFISTRPTLGVGQRAILIQTSHGNVLWDCISYLDTETIEWVNSKGGLKAIVISHPHYYTTHLDWAQTFSCPVYTHKSDEQWLNRADTNGQRKLLLKPTEEILPGVTAINCGGHFDGSLLLHFENILLIADSIAIVPSGLYQIDRPRGTVSFAFMWSYPNFIPLEPSKIHGIWKSITPFSFDTALGAFTGQNVQSPDLKAKLLQSAQIQVRAAGHVAHEIHEETT